MLIFSLGRPGKLLFASHAATIALFVIAILIMFPIFGYEFVDKYVIDNAIIIYFVSIVITYPIMSKYLK